LKFGVRIGHDK